MKDVGEGYLKNFLKDQIRLLMTIELKTPIIILPIWKDAHYNYDFIFKPGDVKIVGDTFSNQDSNTKKNKLYDTYSIQIN